MVAAEVAGPSGRSPAAVRERLRELSDRFYGGHAVNMRQRPIPWAYRVFFRQIGLDPDRTRTPVEQLAFERIRHGGFRSRNQLDDALTIATVETGVALRAFDSGKLEGELGIRASAPGESLEGRPGELPAGTLVIADERRPVGLLFGPTAEGRGVHPSTKSILIAAVQVKGVPAIAVEEALWMASTVMAVGREEG
jgi:DNA/RNA-binding domain of Phe-tRNA-synthetase-like protein